MTHTLKIIKTFAEAKLAGDKLFEIRDNSDRGFQRGDIVRYAVLDEDGWAIEEHPLSKKQFVITYVLHFKGVEPGYVVFGEREINS